MFLKYEDGENYLYVNVEAENNMQDRNAIKLHTKEFISNFIDDGEMSDHLIIGRKLRSELIEVEHNEFCNLINRKFKELKDNAIDGKVFKIAGGIFPSTILKGYVADLEYAD